jgi:hypothetical protein
MQVRARSAGRKQRSRDLVGESEPPPGAAHTVDFVDENARSRSRTNDGHALVEIGAEISEQFDVIPKQFGTITSRRLQALSIRA